MEIKNMSTEELQALRSLITEEKAIKEYCEVTNSLVEIVGQYDTIDLHGTEDFSEISRIIVPDEY